MSYVANIGLEVHVQLKTRGKMFCACRVEFGARANSRTCPICLGYPGALPVANHDALLLTVLTGLMLDCEIAPVCRFDRKNYFYPDLAKNYQTSQYEMPLCRNGSVLLYELAYPKDAQKSIMTPDKRVALVRIHLEEDVAKSFHFETSTGIDFNRAGTPLMEIVSQPEIVSPDEAFAYLTSLKQILVYGKVSDAGMEKGQLRCDCNVSVRPSESQQLGAKIEIKNMNSISGVRRALAYEIKRQTAALDRGETLEQETRGWDDSLGQTFLMRTKESAHDYRYFPDPDLVPIETQLLVTDARRRLSELPHAKRVRFVEQYGLSAYNASVLAADLDLANYFERAAAKAKTPTLLANWIVNDLQSVLTAAGKGIRESPIAPDALRDLVALIEGGTISGKQAKDVFAEMFATGKSASTIVGERGLEQVSDASALEVLCEEVISANSKAVADFKSGNGASLNFLKGQVMKVSRGKANPQLVGDILQRKLMS